MKSKTEKALNTYDIGFGVKLHYRMLLYVSSIGSFVWQDQSIRFRYNN